MKILFARWLLPLILITAVTESRSEMVTLYGKGDRPQASSDAYTNTYSLDVVQTQSGTFTNWCITVRAYETVKLVYAKSAYVYVSTGGVATNSVVFTDSGPGVENLAFVGPGQLTIQPTGFNYVFATFSITRNDDFAGPQNTVAIPADAAGPVTVNMETSTNLVSWQPASPGSYGVSSAMRFFRLRAVRDIQ